MILEVKNLSFAYKNVNVLENISLANFEKGINTIIGPNGSGKSTLIKCLNGILKPRQGKILLDGKSLNQYGRLNLAKIMAYVPQTDSTNVLSTVYETVMMGRKPHVSWRPSARDHKLVEEKIMMLDLEKIAFDNITELSGGQRQRAYIARALAQEPKMLLLDEPTANLDYKHTLDVIEILNKISKQMVIIMTVHDINLASRYSRRVIMMDGGKIFADGPPDIINIQSIKDIFGVNSRLIHDDGHRYFVPESKID